MLLRSTTLRRFSKYATVWARKEYNVDIDVQSYPKGYANPQKLRDLENQVLLAYTNPQTYAQRVIQLAKQLNRQGYYHSVLQLGKTDKLLTGDTKKQLLEQQQYAQQKLPADQASQYSLKTPYPVKNFLFWGFLKHAWKFYLAWVIYLYVSSYGLKETGKQMEESLNPSSSSAKAVKPEKNIQTRFTDVIGVDEFKEELMQITDYLKNPEKYRDAGGRLPKGILLVGPPGTGKTLMARALAGEAKCNFFYKSGAEFDEVFVGEGAARVRELFKEARKHSPSIIFIDEIDSLAGKRGGEGIYVNNAGRETISEVLTAMDGFKPNQNIIVIGATNMEENIDPAIKRAGRFDKILHVPIPDIEGRKQLFSFYLNKAHQNEGLSIEALAKRTTGFTGADIQNMVNLAILNAVKSHRQQTLNQDYEYAYDRILMGVGRTKMVISAQTKKLTAYRQVGQAITSLLTPGATPLHKVTILPRGKSMGFTSSVPSKDILNHTKKSIHAQIDVLMGGRVAEELFSGLNNITATSAQSLAKATQLAYTYLTTGMDQDFSLIYADSKFEVSQQLKFQIDKRVDIILSDSHQRVRKLLSKQKSNVNKIVAKLMEKETLTAEDLKSILKIK